MTTESAPDVRPRRRRGFLIFLRDVLVIIVMVLAIVQMRLLRTKDDE